jgi:hypothetical protein
LFGLCVRADAAAVLAAFEDLGLLKTFPAAEAAFLDVTSLFAMFCPLSCGQCCLDGVPISTHDKHIKHNLIKHKMWWLKKYSDTTC